MKWIIIYFNYSIHNIELESNKKIIEFNTSYDRYLRCEDIDECTLKTDDCHPDAICSIMDLILISAARNLIGLIEPVLNHDVSLARR